MGPGRSRRFRGLGHAGAALSGHFVRTNPSTGLTSRLADRVVQLLTEDSPLPGPIRAPQPLALRRGGSAATRDADGAATCTPLSPMCLLAAGLATCSLDRGGLAVQPWALAEMLTTPVPLPSEHAP